MNSKPKTRNLKNAYTNAPELHPNLILGSLQLLFWLFFHPSAWRNHVARIDPTLHPDFALAELSPAQWRNPTLRRLLMMVYVVWPFLVGSLVGLVLWVGSMRATRLRQAEGWKKSQKSRCKLPRIRLGCRSGALL